MDKRKVLWIFAGGMRRNGICVSQLDYYKTIDKNKFKIDVLAVHNNTVDMINDYKNAGCDVYELPDRRKKTPQYLKQLRKLLIKEKYDVVHVHGSSTLMFLELLTAKKCGVKVRIAHSRNTTCDRPWLEKIFRNSFDNSYNVALACGEDAGKWLFQDKDFAVFHNGKELTKYQFNADKRKKMRKNLGIADGMIAIGHVGLFNEQKNHHFLIEVFQDIFQSNKNAKLFLMGIGPKMEEIKEMVERLNLKDAVSFLGSVSNVNDYLQAMDVMLFPSLFEGLPNVVIEWQASGLPCIISDKITKECAVSELVHFMPIEEGAQCWKEQMERIPLQSEEEREQSSKLACELLKKNGFELETNTRNLEEIYRNSIKEFGDK